MLTVTKRKKNSTLSPTQATFNRQRRKIERLRTQIDELKIDLEKALALYHSTLLPLRKETTALISEFIIKLRDLTKDTKVLNKNELEIVHDIICDSINTIFNMVNHCDISQDIKNLHEEYFGKSVEESFREQIDIIKNEFKKHGGIDDIDFSDLDPNESLQETLEKIAKAAYSAKEEQDKTPPRKPKSKKETLKEEKAHKLEQLQNKGLNIIYKRLAKELHPDLEQDPDTRIEKETLMKRLTSAYEANDLLTMLQLESEWLSRDDGSTETIGEETLKIYNSVLKDQITSLQNEFHCSGLHPRFFQIQDCIMDMPTQPVKAIYEKISECEEMIRNYTIRISDISGPESLKHLKQILQLVAMQNKEETFFENCLLEMLGIS